MVVVVEILRNLKDPAGCNGWTKSSAHMDVVVHVPDRCPARARIIEHKVRMEVAVKVSYYSPARCNDHFGAVHAGVDQFGTADVGVDQFGRCRRDNVTYK